MYSVAIKAKAFYDNQISNDNLIITFKQKGGWMITHVQKEKQALKLQEFFIKNYGLDSKVYKID